LNLSATFAAFIANPRPQPLHEEPLYVSRVDRETFAAQRFPAIKLSAWLSLDFLCGRVRLSQPSVLLTFDDGEKSLYHAAFPILQQ
jgi:peptidoglycan/xylan/chitin deacetylase (PgdA/CDA1 family)